MAMGEQERSRWEQQLRDAARHVEEDVRRVVNYINDEVVPDVRQNSSHALRFAARELEKLAQRMDDRRAAAAGSQPPPPAEK
jgi:glutamyl-tRNA reductase